MREKRVNDSPDALVARIAARQHGIVSVRQLHAAELDRNRIRRRVDAGRLHRLFRGVYAVGHTGLSTEGRLMAAVLAGGEGAAVSHRSAAELWGMLEPGLRPVDVTVPVAGGRRRRVGIRIHRSLLLTHRVTTRRHGIAVTTPARTIDDLRGCAPPRLVRRAIRQAEYDGLPVGKNADETGGTRSDLEARFLRLCRRHGLPEPEINVAIGRFTVDFLWRKPGLVVETDAFRTHRGEQAFLDDRERDNELMALGLEVMRFTDVRIENEPRDVVSLVRTRLHRRREPPTPTH
jgi:very-short-patch-repair endonuclease